MANLCMMKCMFDTAAADVTFLFILTSSHYVKARFLICLIVLLLFTFDPVRTF